MRPKSFRSCCVNVEPLLDGGDCNSVEPMTEHSTGFELDLLMAEMTEGQDE